MLKVYKAVFCLLIYYVECRCTSFNIMVKKYSAFFKRFLVGEALFLLTENGVRRN